MDRQALIKAILKLECDFPVDLTPEYLRALSLAKLRHVYSALCTHSKNQGAPEGP